MKSNIFGVCLVSLTICCSQLQAGRAIWNLDAATGDWNTAANWTPATVPNGPIDVAIFATSSTFILGPTVGTEVNSIIFAEERFYVIQPTTGSLTISGAGIINNNSVTQSFLSSSDSGSIIFTNSAKAGTHVAFTAEGTLITGEPGGRIHFTGNADAAANTFKNFGGETDVGSNGMTEFFDNSTAASATFTNYGGVYSFDLGGLTIFHDTSTAANATFINIGAVGAYPGEVDFLDASTAANASFTSNGTMQFEDSATAANAAMTLGDDEGGFGQTFFYDDSTAASATITMLNGQVNFYDGASAGTSTIVGNNTFGGAFVTFNLGTTLDHATLISNSSCHYYINSTAASGNIIINALGSLYCNDADSCTVTVNGAASDAAGGQVYFSGNAGHSAFTVNGASASGKDSAGLLEFYDSANAGSSTITANGGTDGGLGGMVRFYGHSDGRTAQVELFGNSRMRLGLSRISPLALGSLEGTGLVTLEGESIIIGGNNLSTEFSGVIEDSLDGAISGGQVSKTGTGSLTLSGANTYTGGTTIESGTLLVTNLEGSATGAGAVSVEAGTLGGNGIVAGAVTLGTGTGSGAFLAPAHDTKTPTTLTIQSGVTFNSDSTYIYTFRAKGNRSTSDSVLAQGVTINNAAMLALSGRTQGALSQGLVLTVISNTAATPISGTFGNLPDGAIVNVNGNNLQASYEGGGGNDLTLTVVP